MARRVKKSAARPGRPVEAVRHRKDSRVNIPTAELEPLAEDAAKRPETIRYPRDPSLDPQLVWKGKGARAASKNGSTLRFSQGMSPCNTTIE